MQINKTLVSVALICTTALIYTTITSIKEVYIAKIENLSLFRVPIPHEFCCPQN